MKDVANAVKGVSPVLTNPSRAANAIHWSPTGKNMVLAGLKVRNLGHREAAWCALHRLPPVSSRRPSTSRTPGMCLRLFHCSDECVAALASTSPDSLRSD